MIGAADPVEPGLIASFSRPGAPQRRRRCEEAFEDLIFEWCIDLDECRLA
jgi:hypothetical protein